MNTYEPFAFGRALSASELTTKAKITGFCLSVHADGKTGYCYPTQEQLAAATSQSVPTVTRALAELAAAGFVTVAKNERKRYNRNNLYWLRVPKGTRALARAVDEQPPPEPEPQPQTPKVAEPMPPPVKTFTPEPAPSLTAFPQEPAWLRGDSSTEAVELALTASSFPPALAPLATAFGLHQSPVDNMPFFNLRITYRRTRLDFLRTHRRQGRCYRYRCRS